MELVYQNIEDSVYSIEIDNIEFYFSSSFNLRRFKEKSIEYAMQEERKLINRYHVDINMEIYFLIAFYKKIEKRGFLIKYKDTTYREDILTLNTII